MHDPNKGMMKYSVEDICQVNITFLDINIITIWKIYYSSFEGTCERILKS